MFQAAQAVRTGTPRIAIVLDPRFPGGTSSAVAQELPVLSGLGAVEVHGITSSMFKDAPVNPTLKQALAESGHEITWDQPVISADIIVFHNPSLLKFDEALSSRLVCQFLIVVTHENFLTPLGDPGFDVAGCLERIEAASLCAHRYLAPVSSYNRETVARWSDGGSDWPQTKENWFNICDFEIQPPTKTPRDRRGRHSRSGPEKFPDLETLHILFPAHAERNVILGADHIAPRTPVPHWSLYNFRTIPVPQMLLEIDFFVYFTHPTWRESFGRVLAEATAAGKLVITDPATAKNFGDGIIGAEPSEVDGLIADLIDEPDIYAQTVERAQSTLRAYAPEIFAQMCGRIISQMQTSKRQTAV